ncbi:MAG TPA: hypothetical protein VEL79_06680 [Vicinamibacterales bacterium]|nr:hypothetical protein [Vicinamibacterales bacterium]
MADQDESSRKSKMEKAEGDRETAEANQRGDSGPEPEWLSDPRDQESTADSVMPGDESTIRTQI